MTDARCGRCGGALDPRSGACDACGSTGLHWAVFPAAAAVGTLLGALLVVTPAVALAWLGLASALAVGALVRHGGRPPAASAAALWLIAVGGGVAASMASLLLRAHAQVRARAWLLTAIHVVAGAVAALVALRR